MFLTHYEPISRALSNLAGSVHADHLAPLVPAADIVEKDDAWVYSLDLPGVPLDAIDIEIKGDILTVSAKRDTQEEVNKDNYTYFERSVGSFQRTFSLPADIDPERVSANSTNGVLEISVGRKEHEAPRKIAVTPKVSEGDKGDEASN